MKGIPNNLRERLILSPKFVLNFCGPRNANGCRSVDCEGSVMSYFIPVCLYPHTKYRTRAGVIYLLEKFELRSCDYLIVVADELLFLDRLVTGRFWTIDQARKKTTAGPGHS